MTGVLVGRAASAGCYRGFAQVCRTGAEVDAVPPGCVLVVETALVGHAAAFARIGALVAEHGGILGSCLTVAREQRLPAVVGVEAATKLIRSGDQILVDGTRGIVVRAAGTGKQEILAAGRPRE